MRSSVGATCSMIPGLAVCTACRAAPCTIYSCNRTPALGPVIVQSTSLGPETKADLPGSNGLIKWQRDMLMVPRANLVAHVSSAGWSGHVSPRAGSHWLRKARLEDKAWLAEMIFPRRGEAQESKSLRMLHGGANLLKATELVSQSQRQERGEWVLLRVRWCRDLHQGGTETSETNWT